jgi:hypothetical protein
LNTGGSGKAHLKETALPELTKSKASVKRSRKDEDQGLDKTRDEGKDDERRHKVAKGV